MPGNHQLFIRRDDVTRDTCAVARNPPLTPVVGRRVELETEPRQTRRHRLANIRRVLPDAGGEDEAVDAAHRGDERAGEQGNAINEIVERELAPWRTASLQVPHVAAQPGEAFQPAIVIEKPLDLLRLHALLV